MGPPILTQSTCICRDISLLACWLQRWYWLPSADAVSTETARPVGTEVKDLCQPYHWAEPAPKAFLFYQERA